MDEVSIDGVILTSLRRIAHPQGDILHALKRSDAGYVDFGEAYFSTIKTNEIKSWKKHNAITLNLVVPYGEIRFVIYDDREFSVTKGRYCDIVLSQSHYKRLTIPSGLWVAFQGIGDGMNLLLNITDLEHDPNEITRLKLSDISYHW